MLRHSGNSDLKWRHQQVFSTLGYVVMLSGRQLGVFGIGAPVRFLLMANTALETFKFLLQALQCLRGTSFVCIQKVI